MTDKHVICIGAGLLAAMIAACLAVVVLKVEVAPKDENGKPVERKRNFGEGLKLGRHGLYGVDLVTIGKAHMRKVRRGPFTIGALNELVLENVSIVLPEEAWRDGGVKNVSTNGEKSAESPRERGAKEMLSKLGIAADDLKFGSKMPRFSALTIKRIMVSRHDGTNAVPWFAAMVGKAERSGLALSGCWTFENGTTNACESAMLVLEPRLELKTVKKFDIKAGNGERSEQ